MTNAIARSWKTKRWLWSHWHTLRYSLAKPQHIGPPKPSSERISTVSMRESHGEITAQKVQVFAELPKDEKSFGMRASVSVALALNKVLRPMRPGLPEIDPDINKALSYGLSNGYAAAFRAPVLPDIYAGVGVPEIGDLAVESPYSLFLERAPDGTLQMDFMKLGEFEHQEGLRSLGVTVRFSASADSGRLTANEIESEEYGTVRPENPDWEASSVLAVCAATTHMSLTRHFNYVHLVSGDHWEVATRNHLPTDHPLYRLVWPHIFNSLFTNYAITSVQMLPDGDFVNIFSFTHSGLMKYYDAMYEEYDIRMTDPEADWERRGLDGSTFSAPSHENLCEMFDLAFAHTNRYVNAYYESDEELREDAAVSAWLSDLDSLIPNGLNGALNGGLAREGLARIIAAYIYEGNTIHDLTGTSLWDYQLWVDRNPVRVYTDGRRLPVDVYQRLIVNNFALQIKRAPMLADYGQVAIDDRGVALFTQYYEECQALQDRYDQTEAGPWRMEPKNLEISMNG
jgi:arachidonate 15-lipoxygenase